MLRNSTRYNGLLVDCSFKGDVVHILLATKSRTDIMKNGCYLARVTQQHLGYNSWTLSQDNFPLLAKKLCFPISAQVMVEEYDDHTRISVVAG